MKRHIVKVFATVAAVMFLSMTVLELTAHARAGGSRSMGSRGSRSYSGQTAPSTQSAPSRQMAPAPNQFQQPSAGGGFMRSMAGGIAGGLLGGMLFRSLGMAGTGGMGGGGIGIFEILLLAGIGYMIYRFVKKKREMAPVLVRNDAYQEQAPYQGGYQTPYQPPYQAGSAPNVYNEPASVDAGLSHIRQMDYSFDERVFKDTVMDLFFKVQGGWMNRDMAALSPLLTEEMRVVFQDDVNKLLRDKQVNRLENIAVRSVDISEAWQESGQDYISTLIYANLLDYTTDDTTGAVVAGSKTEPVKFEEYWTFTRPVGNNAWRLSAISQK